MKPIWVLSGTGKIILYDMDTTHIINARNKLLQRSGSQHLDVWVKWFQEELQAREGEVPGNPGNLTIEQLKAARELRRVLLGLPPVIPVEPIPVKYDKPKKSLFEYD